MNATVNGNEYRLYFRYQTIFPKPIKVSKIGNSTILTEPPEFKTVKSSVPNGKPKKVRTTIIKTTAVLSQFGGIDLYGRRKYFDLARASTDCHPSDQFVKENGRRHALEKLSAALEFAKSNNLSDKAGLLLSAAKATETAYLARKSISTPKTRQTLSVEQIEELKRVGRAKKAARLTVPH